MSLYNIGIVRLSDGDSTWSSGTPDIELMLMLSSYSFNRDSDNVSDIVASETTTTNYVRQNVASRTVTVDDTNDRAIYDCADNVYASLGPSSGGPTLGSAVHMRNTGTDSTSPLLNNLPFTPTTVNGGQFTVQYAATGAILGTSPEEDDMANEIKIEWQPTLNGGLRADVDAWAAWIEKEGESWVGRVGLAHDDKYDRVLSVHGPDQGVILQQTADHLRAAVSTAKDCAACGRHALPYRGTSLVRCLDRACEGRVPHEA